MKTAKPREPSEMRGSVAGGPVAVVPALVSGRLSACTGAAGALLSAIAALLWLAKPRGGFRSGIENLALDCANDTGNRRRPYLPSEKEQDREQ